MSTEGRDRLTKEQLERADALAAEALAMPGDQREEFLARRCGDDPAVRAEVGVVGLDKIHTPRPLGSPGSDLQDT